MFPSFRMNEKEREGNENIIFALAITEKRYGIFKINFHF